MLKSAPPLSLPYSRAFRGSPLPSIPDPRFHSLLPSQNNLISKVPRGALSRQTHLRELYLQHNQLTDSGLDATTFRWGLGQGGMGCSFVLGVGAEDSEPGAATLCPLLCITPTPAASFGEHSLCARSAQHPAATLATNYRVLPSCYPTSQLPHADLDSELCPGHPHL